MTAITAAAAILAWVAAAYRFATTVRDSPTLWRWSFTLSIIFLAVGISVFDLNSYIDAGIGVPSLANLLLHTTVAASAGCVCVFLLTLMADEVSRGPLVASVVVAVVTESVIIASWAAAPFHTHEMRDIAVAAVTPATLVYSVTWYLYLGLVLGLMTIWCLRELRERRRLPAGTRLGLLLIGLASTIGVLTFAVAVARVTLHAAAGGSWLVLSALLKGMMSLVLAGVSLGTVIFLAAPPIARRRYERRLSGSLEPLAARVKELYPAVSLGPKKPVDCTQHLLRLRTEIADGLRLLPVDPHRSPGRPEQAIAEALTAPPDTGQASAIASSIAPRVVSTAEEDEWLITLARAYGARSAARVR